MSCLPRLTGVLSIVSLLALALIAPTSAAAGSLTCGSGGGPFCAWTGKIDRVYVNDSQVILMYYDVPVDVTALTNAGLTCASPSSSKSALFKISNAPTYAEYLYSTLLTAKSWSRNV